MMAGLYTASLLSLLFLLPITILASPHGYVPVPNRHRELARRAEANISLYQRVSGARWSFYDTETGNAGSCGNFLSDSGFTVAMNAHEMNSGLCGKTIVMTYGGKTTTASIQDTCPGCPPDGLDLTPSLFAFFAPVSVGIIYGTWTYADAAPAAPAPSPSPTPTPTWSPSPVWTSSSEWSSIWSSPVWTPPAPSYTPTSISTEPNTKPTSTSESNTWTSNAPTSSSSVPASSSTQSINYSSGPASGLAEPTSVPQATPGNTDTGNNIAQLFQALIQIGTMIMNGHD